VIGHGDQTIALTPHDGIGVEQIFLLIGMAGQVGVQLYLGQIRRIDVAAGRPRGAAQERREVLEAIPSPVVRIQHQAGRLLQVSRGAGQPLEDHLAFRVHLLPERRIHVAGSLDQLVQHSLLPIGQAIKQRAPGHIPRREHGGAVKGARRNRARVESHRRLGDGRGLARLALAVHQSPLFAFTAVRELAVANLPACFVSNLQETALLDAVLRRWVGHTRGGRCGRRGRHGQIGGITGSQQQGHYQERYGDEIRSFHRAYSNPAARQFQLKATRRPGGGNQYPSAR